MEGEGHFRIEGPAQGEAAGHQILGRGFFKKTRPAVPHLRVGVGLPGVGVWCVGIDYHLVQLGVDVEAVGDILAKVAGKNTAENIVTAPVTPVRRIDLEIVFGVEAPGEGEGVVPESQITVLQHGLILIIGVAFHIVIQNGPLPWREIGPGVLHSAQRLLHNPKGQRAGRGKAVDQSGYFGNFQQAVEVFVIHGNGIETLGGNSRDDQEE